MADKKCLEGCPHCSTIYSAPIMGWTFKGCHAKPYKGKWVKEIKPEDCPLNKKDGEN